MIIKAHIMILEMDSLKKNLSLMQDDSKNRNTSNNGLIIFFVILSIPSLLLILKIIEYIPSKKAKPHTYEKEIETDILENFNIIKQRLYNEIENNYNQSNLHFLIAFLISWFLISFIGYFFIFSYNSSFKELENWIDFTILYLPRLLIVIGFGTLFLYYMKSYKTKLIDIKYYQNEITNIELKLIAFNTAFIKDNNVSDKILMNFIETERNYKLNTNETTKELEHLKIENELNTKYLDKFWDLANIFKENNKQNSGK